MASKEISITLSADIKSLTSGVSEAKAAVKSAMDMEGTKDTFKNIKNSAQEASTQSLKAQNIIQRAADTVGIRDTFRNVKRSISETISKFRSIRQAGIDAGNGIKQGTDKATRGLKQVQREAQATSGVISRIKGAVVGAFGVAAIYSFGKAILSASADAELLRKGLEFQIGAEGADTLVHNIQQIGEASAYDTNQLIPMAKAWVNIGNNAEEATKKMKTIVDAASAYGMTTDQIDRANLALTQMKMAGKITQQDMMQLINAGVPAWDLLAEHMHLSVQELKDLSSKGQLTDVDELFRAMEAKSKGASERLADTLTGKFSNMKESIQNSFAGLGDILVQALDLKEILEKMGDFAEKFKEHIQSIKEKAKDMGVKEAISDELEEIDPKLNTIYGTFMYFFEGIGKFCVEHKGIILDLIETYLEWKVAIGIIHQLKKGYNLVTGAINGMRTAYETAKAMMAAAEIATQGTKIGKAFEGAHKAVEIFKGACKWSKVLALATLTGILDGIQSGFVGATRLVQAFYLTCMAHPIIAALMAVLAIIILIWQNWDTVKKVAATCLDAISDACEKTGKWIKDKFHEAISKVKEWWQDLKNFLEHPIDTIVRVHKQAMKEEHETSSRARAQGAEERKRAAQGYANGGVFGMAKGGVVGGFVPLANGGQLKNGTPAIVGEAGPEAVVPLKDTVLAKIGEAILRSYEKKKANNKDKQIEIISNIRSKIEKGPINEYAKILREAAKKAADVGAEVARWNEYQKEVADNAAKYEENGEKMKSYQQSLKMTSDEDKKNELTEKYEKEKSDAIKLAEEVAAKRVEVEEAAAATIEQIRKDAADRVNAHETAIQNAEMQLRKANQAQSMQEFVDMMNEKDEITGESYAATLAAESNLAEQRRAWHDEVMENATSWSDFMQTTLTNIAAQLKEDVSSGISNCIMQGKTLGETFLQIGSNILNMFIKNIIQKWISGLGIIRALNKVKSTEEIAQVKATTAAEAGKSGVLASNATASLIAAAPYTIAGAASAVLAQMSRASAAGVIHLAKGGSVFGKGTSTSDSIPAMLSRGEYVVNAEAVRQIGIPALNAINAGESPRFAMGGIVGGGTDERVQPITGGTVNLHVSALDASSFVDFLENGALDKIKQKLFEDNHDFATDAGVW